MIDPHLHCIIKGPALDIFASVSAVVRPGVDATVMKVMPAGTRSV